MIALFASLIEGEHLLPIQSGRGPLRENPRGRRANALAFPQISRRYARRMPGNNKDGLRRLLDWNRRHLTSTSTLSESGIAEIFAPQFVVKANGRTHPANHRTYLEFLNGFRRTIQAIDYDVHNEVDEGSNMVIVCVIASIGDNVTRVPSDH